MRLSGVLLSALLLASCESSMPLGKSSSPRRDINAVLADHDKSLLARPGVVGVYVGLMPDEKTPCLVIMLQRADPQLERSLPKQLEGHPVRLEISGEIRPLEH